MLTRQRKAEIVDELRQKLGRARGIYMVDFAGMTVADSQSLRMELRQKGIEYKVAKNTLIRRALQALGDHRELEQHLVGQTALILSYTDGIAPARLLYEFIKRVEKPRLKAASVEGQYFSGEQLEQLAAMPSREELIAGILGSLQAPVAGIAGAIGAVLRDIAYLVEEVARQRNRQVE
ncbi:MAG: 50S ribosomal protein L10 [Candidatus Kapabacteria bacterium]|nr:50S ribosomal protein L10 [Candidatus Kapabacteria bacterium]MDW8012747.1 50S ribosomal protein L10 [Bacteroidota bacterium]